MLIREIINVIEQFAPPACQAPWDSSGLQTTALTQETDRIAVFLDPLPHVIARAATAGAGFLLSHHPLSLNPQLPNKQNNWFFSLKELLEANLHLYAAHTSLDVQFEGPASWLGRELGLEDMKPLEASDCGCKGKAGYGGIGHLPFPVRFPELLNRILNITNCAEASLCGPRPCQEISVVAWCGGSGASFISRAAEMGAQLYVTGDIKYHYALEAPIPVLDVGHHALEEEMMARFARVLEREMPSVKVMFLPSLSPFQIVHLGD